MKRLAYRIVDVLAKIVWYVLLFALVLPFALADAMTGGGCIRGGGLP